MSFTNGQSKDPMVEYSFSALNAAQGILQVELQFEMPASEVGLQLPTWRPGRYEIANYAQNILSIELRSNSGELRKTESSKWVVNGEPGQLVRIAYTYYARKMDAGNSWVDLDQIYVNPINCCFEVQGLEDVEHQMRVNCPAEYLVGTALNQKEGVYIAEDYQKLVDSPFIASPSIKEQIFQLEETTFHIWVQGNVSPDWEDLIQKMKAYTKPQMSLFGGFPTKDYHYFFQILPYRHYHGVEHQDSTVITLGPDSDYFNGDFQTNLMGISAHELFHTWNVTRIRPKELYPYDFSKQAYFNTGYVAEGVTTYYGDLMLSRGGVFNESEYFSEINGYFNRHFRNYGRHSNSLANSSLDLWLDGYKIGAPNRKVSIYIKGALCAMLLDLKIRRATNSLRSLDDVMKLMWLRYAEAGYSSDDYKVCAEEVMGESLDQYFEDYIFGVRPIEEELNQVLDYVGCTMVQKEHESQTAKLGYLLSPSNVVMALAPDSQASSVLQLGDIHKEGELFNRNGLEIVAKIEPMSKNYFTSFEIQFLEERTPEMRSVFSKWTKNL